MRDAGRPAIELRDVHKSFGDVPVLRGVDLEIARGSVTVVCGPSGSGKSTLIRLVNGLEAPTRGEVRIDGESLGRLRPRALRLHRTRIGFVFQQFNLYPHLTAQENVALAPRRVLGVPAGEAARQAVELLAQVGLADRADSYPGQLSGGQQQRVAIARALAMHPRILLFDEPTSALDPEMIGEVLEVIRGLAGADITMLVVTHEMGFAREVSDRIVFIDEGRVQEDARPAEFFTATRSPRARQFLRQILSPLHA